MEVGGLILTIKYGERLMKGFVSHTLDFNNGCWNLKLPPDCLELFMPFNQQGENEVLVCCLGQLVPSIKGKQSCYIDNRTR